LYNGATLEKPAQSMKQFLVFSILLTLLWLFPSRLNSQVSDTPKATILFTGDVNGYIEPCG